jgi:chromosomal replication initiation ATPase DnaA
LTRQLAFDLASRAALRREDFFVTDANRLALETLDAWAGWPGRKCLLLGPEGSGKSHLAAVWAAGVGGQVLPIAALATADLGAFAGARVAVEDADQGSPAEAAGLFHLHNLVTGQGALLVTAQTPPGDWASGLPDLVSRMQAATVARLDPPDDALLSAVLVKLFADRQVAVAPALIPYLVARMPRSVAAARGLVAELDARALAEGRPITRALAAGVLDSHLPG